MCHSYCPNQVGSALQMEGLFTYILTNYTFIDTYIHLVCVHPEEIRL